MRLAFLICFLLIACFTHAQSGMNILNDGFLHEVRIQIANKNWFDTLTAVYENNKKDPKIFPDSVRPCAVVIDGLRYDSIGIRFRGNSSYSFNVDRLKKPFKLELDAYLNLKADGLKNINLNNCTDDPSFVREALCYRLLRDMNILAPRTAYTRVYINDEYWGLYMLVENIDKTFLKDHFGSKGNEGNLYKTAQSGQAYLKTMDTKDSLYQKNSGLELKTNEKKNDWSRIIAFTNLLSLADSAHFRDSLYKVFNVDYYLHILALEKLVYSWDSYWSNGNNYYLYEHPDGTIHWICWDMNETFPGDGWSDPSAITLQNYLLPTNLYNSRPLMRALFLNSGLKNRYFDIVCELMKNNFTTANIDTIVLRWHQQIADAVKEDENKFFAFADFDQSLTGETIDADLLFPRSGIRIRRRLPAIIPFISKQQDWAAEEMALHEYPCIYSRPSSTVYNMSIAPNPSNTTNFRLTWLEDSPGLSRLQFINSVGQVVAEMFNLNSDKNSLQAEIERLVPGLYMVRKIDASGKIGICKWVRF